MIEASYPRNPGQTVALAGGGTNAVAARAPSGRMALGAAAGAADDIGPAYSDSLTFWTRGLGSWGEFNGNGNAATARRTLGGFVSGMDAKVGDGWRAGLATGYMQSNINVGARASSADVDGYILAAYGGGTAGPFALRSGAAWTWNTIDSSRSVMFPGFYERELAGYSATTGQLFAEAAYPMLTEHGPLEPFAGLAWVHVGSDGFTESGPTAALTSSNASEDAGFSTLGIRAATTPQPAWGITVTPRGSIAWQHAFGDLNPTQAFAFASNAIAFGISGVPVVQDSALIDAGFDFALGSDAFLSVSYVGQLATGVHDNGVQGRLDWRF
jgi:outer membrane autotransporter protein